MKLLKRVSLVILIIVAIIMIVSQMVIDTYALTLKEDWNNVDYVVSSKYAWDFRHCLGYEVGMHINCIAYRFNNIYCIQKGRCNTNNHYNMYYSIEIEGEDATLIDHVHGEPSFTWSSPVNNIMAGILTPTSYVWNAGFSDNRGNYTMGFTTDTAPGGNLNYSAAQLAVHTYWETFESTMLNAIKESGNAFKFKCWDNGLNGWDTTGNFGTYANESGRGYVNAVEKLIEDIDFKVTIGILDNTKGDEKCSSSHTCGGAKRQNMITTIPGTPTPGVTTDFTVKKEWDDLDNKFGIRPSEIKVTLYSDKDDKEVTQDYYGNKITNPITLSSENASGSNLWTYTFKDLARKDGEGKDAKDITYYVKETATTNDEDAEKFAEYKQSETSISKGYKFINELETIDIPITKVWEDFTDQYKNRPKSISVSLYRGDQKIETKTITAPTNKTTPWTATFTGLRKYEKGEEIQYTVKEDEVPLGYTTNITGDMTGYTITNTLNTINIEFKKVWEDAYNGIDNFDEIRPAQIQIQLQNKIGTAKFANVSGMKNTAYHSKITLKPIDASSNTWTYTYTDLPVYKNGQLTEYKIIETAITDYKQKEGYEEATKDNNYTIINVHEPYYVGYIEIRGKAWLEGNPGKATEMNGTYGKEDKGLSGIKVSLKTGDTGISATYTDENGEFTRKDYALTDSDGNYTIRVNYDNTKNVYDLHNNLTILATNLRNSYVEFEYDGMLYTTVAPKIEIFGDNENTSKVVEDATRRNTVDRNNTAVEYKTSHPDNLKWDNKKITAKTNTVMPFSGIEAVLEYYNKENSKNMTFEEFINSLDTSTNKTYKDNFKKDYEAAKKINPTLITNEDDFKNYIIEMVQHESATVTVKHVDTAKKKTYKTSYKEAWVDKTTNITANDTVDKQYEVNVAVIENVNIGLFKREQPDVAVSIDISEVQITMDGTEYIYTRVVDLNADTSDVYRDAYYDAINNKGMTNEEAKEYAIKVVGEKAYEEAYNDAINNKGMTEEEAKEYAKQVEIEVKFQNKYTYTYRRAVNPNNITYTGTGTKTTSELEVYVTYDVKVKNLSSTLPVTVNSIVNYFDSNYTLDTKSSTKGWSAKADVTGETRYDKTTYNTAITVAPGDESEPIKLKYKVNLPEKVTSKDTITIQEKIRLWLESEYPLNNAVEIAKYSTQYGENTLYAEQRTGGKVNNKGIALPYAGYDYDSHPGNVIGNATKKENYRISIINVDGQDRIEIKDREDDEDIAPPFILELPQPITVDKQLSGIVYEDLDPNDTNDYRLGNGEYDSTEPGIDNVKVELYNLDGTRADIYQYDQDGNILSKKDAVTYTSNGGQYGFAGVEAGEYFIKFTYGNNTDNTTTYYKKSEDTEGNITIEEKTQKELGDNPTKIKYQNKDIEINPRNYKSTIIKDEKVIDSETGSTLKTLLKKEYENYTQKEKEWPENHTKGYSVAVDNMLDRLEISDLTSGTFGDKINMTAYTKPFYVKTEVILESGEEQSVPPIEFNFGIIERPREALIVEKTIEDFSVTLANGQILAQGNPSGSNVSIPYTKALGLSNTNFDGMSATTAIKAIKNRNLQGRTLVIEMDNELIQNSQLNLTYKVTVTNKCETDYDYGVQSDYDTEIKRNITQDVCDSYITKNSLADYYYYGEVSDALQDKEVIAKIKLVDYLNKELSYVEKEQDKWVSIGKSDLYNENVKYIQANVNNKQYNGEALENKYHIFRTYQDVIEIPRGGVFSERMYAKKVVSNKDNNIFDNNTEIIEIDSKTARTVKAKYVENGELIELNYATGSHEPGNEATWEIDTGYVNSTITPPTGLTTNIILYIIITLVGLTVIAGGVIFIKKKVLIK